VLPLCFCEGAEGAIADERGLQEGDTFRSVYADIAGILPGFVPGAGSVWIQCTAFRSSVTLTDRYREWYPWVT